MHRSAHTDSFARDNLPPEDAWPDIDLSHFDYGAQLNAVVSGCTTVVHTDLDRMKSLPWTAEVRSVLSDYCHAEGGR